jgi:Cof subfamily protein (haloacid dehalogenase superfamily)
LEETLLIKLIVSDLDGTLLDANKEVSTREFEALHLSRTQGIAFALASGRMRSEMNKIITQIDQNCICISQNGAFIHSSDGQLLQSTYFEPSLARQAYTMTSSPTIVRLICSGEANYISQLTNASDAIQARMFETFRILHHTEEAIEHELPVCKLSYFGDIQELLTIKRSLELHYGDQLTQFISDIDCLDIMPKGISKGSALLYMLDILNITVDEVACIGDSFNDISMFEVTPHSYAMRHSHPDVKEFARHIVANVAEAIEHIIVQ